MNIQTFSAFSNWDFNRKANFSGLSVFITKFNVSYVSLTEETEKNEIYSDLSAVEKKTLLHCRSLYPEIWKKKFAIQYVEKWGKLQSKNVK